MEEAAASSFLVFEGFADREEEAAMWDTTTSGVVAALKGLEQRNEVRAHNIANAETPGFRAEHVEFETQLADQLRRGTPERTETATVNSPTIVDGRGNSVDVETEMVGSMKDGLQREAMNAAFNFKTSNMRMAIMGRR